ncbi:hypothetical protein QBC38DRAFT_544151 [Podospora fimiseda]|uniref:SUR7 protein n=1 Tax=Podospora fimiseda TaxID=252190 RepID=A0AAN7BSF8_9PEZI|nr:hypothetical protein QBC38DRAFT_544151 [Podospora fimiseda]
MAIRNPFYSIVPRVLNLITLALTCVIIFSGFHKGLTQLYWIRVETGDFKGPSKLDNSQFLKDIGQVSGADLVGGEATAESLGYPKWMGISLFTQCDHFADGHIECYKPSLNLAFNPDRHLRLDRSSAETGQKVRDARDSHNLSIRFISGSFVVGAFCALSAPIEAFFSPALAAITSAIGGILVLAGSIGGTVVFQKLSDAINEDLAQFNITSKTGIYPKVLGFVAAFILILACVLYTLGHRSQTRAYKKRVQAHSIGAKGPGLMSGADGQDFSYSSGTPGGGNGKGGALWNRITPGNNHKYVQVEKQGGAQGQHDATFDRDMEAPGSPTAPGMQKRIDDDWATPDQYSSGGGNTTGAAGNIPMVPLSGNKGTKDLNTAYEPYTARLG